MPLLANIVGFSFVGLAARFGQLGIQGKHMLYNPTGHLISMGTFGFIGYWAHQWDVRAAELIADKKEEIIERRRERWSRANQA